MVNWNIAYVILIVGHSSPAARDFHVTFGGGAAISTVSENLDAFIEKPNEVCVLTTGNRFKGATSRVPCRRFYRSLVVRILGPDLLEMHFTWLGE